MLSFHSQYLSFYLILLSLLKAIICTDSTQFQMISNEFIIHQYLRYVFSSLSVQIYSPRNLILIVPYYIVGVIDPDII